LDGHSCTGNNCIFDNLTGLKNGAKIIIERGDGEKITYIVKEVAVVRLADVDMNKMMRPIVPNQEGLNLITCAGNWTARDSQGVVTMDKRVMVFATHGET
jgi:LPXTG-site transpeptidase (sortase) family protein